MDESIVVCIGNIELQLVRYKGIRALNMGILLLWVLAERSAGLKCSPENCGNFTINYPFGIAESKCGLPAFEIKCKENSSIGTGPIPFLPTPSGEFQILSISQDSLIINSTGLKAMSCNGIDEARMSFQLPTNGPFSIAGTNMFAVIGCSSFGSFYGPKHEAGKCQAACLNQDEPKYCNSYGCCAAGIPGNWQWINFTGGGISYRDFPGKCGFSTILHPDTFSTTEYGVIGAGQYGLKLNWAIGTENCSAVNGSGAYACSKEAECIDWFSRRQGFVCQCPVGYQGDGYSNGTGCTDIDECKNHTLNACVPPPLGVCTNLRGSYRCSCAKGRGDGFQNGTRCELSRSANSAVPGVLGSFSTLVAVLLAGFGIYWCLKQRRIRLLKVKYFQMNGGIKLQQYISSNWARESTKIFSAKEMENATNKFSENMEVGSGGYGTVYKGTLGDGTLVAIKKSKEVDQEEIDQFINEIIILTQLNHRNVVKLLGCCLETQVPLLVYEFVPNGTLFEHLHGKEITECLPWKTRLRIAIETAEALAYLHSSASTPVIHRDVKSSNILLDNTCTPKVADFGVSRLVPMDQTHITTVVQGTLGYLDPEYFQTTQLTDRSDVYSFGVVLVELLTGLKPVSWERSRDETNLSMLFLSRLRRGHLTEILDPELVNVDSQEDMASMQSVGSLAKECLQVEGERRPSMKEVVQELVWIRSARRISSSHSDIDEESTSLLDCEVRNNVIAGAEDTLQNVCNSSSSMPKTVFGGGIDVFTLNIDIMHMLRGGR